MRHSTARRSAGKRPPGFPLFVHQSGNRWCKKVRGKFHYFGKADDDPSGDRALEEWLRVKDDLLAGRKPRPKDGLGLTVGRLCNLFLANLDARIDAGRLAPRARVDYKKATDRLVAFFAPGRSVEDLRADDFDGFYGKLPKTWAQSTRTVFVSRCRAVFNFAHGRHRQLVSRRVPFGNVFCKASAKEARRLRAARGQRDFTADEMRRLLDAADPVFRAALLLGINCGFGNTDVGRLPWSAIAGEWVTFPRPKTGEPRRVWLWPETREALAGVKAAGRQPVDPADGGLVFLTARGRPLVRILGASWQDSVMHLMRATAKRASVGHSFYDLRRTFRTVADATLDTPAIDLVMGHSDGSMGAVYRQRIDDARVKRVCEHVRGWLFGDADPRKGG